MKRHLPNILLKEYSTRGILDTLFAPKIQHSIFENVVDGMKQAIKDNKKEKDSIHLLWQVRKRRGHLVKSLRWA
jgi:hypothetical protein